ncbi:phage major capsid protein [Leeuwenhoekiella sp. LLG6367-2.1]|uniref:phage major capsid protein n=1 Tax=Leeuwenhoekiella sp. LLG6367-2.1 TaxID=3160833 RepID=UPI003867D542
MKKSDELKQERQALIDAQNNLVEKAQGEKREFTTEENTAFDKRHGEIEDFNAKITRAEAAEKLQLEKAKRTATPVHTGLGDGEQKEEEQIKKRASILVALNAVRSGLPLTGAEKEMHELGELENKRAKVESPENSLLTIPMSMLRATAQTVSEDGGDYGGQLVQDQAPRVQMPFAPSSILGQLGVTRMTGLSGGKIPLPVAENYDFAWLGETETINVQKKKFDGPALDPKRLGAAVEISNRLLIQSSPDVEGMIRQLIANGYDRAINAAAINGSGADNQPTGVLNAAGVQVSTITAGAAPTRKSLLELMGLVDTADATEESLAFLMTKLLRTDLMGRLADAGSGRYLMNTKDELAGYAAYASSFVPQLAGGLQPLIYGDWSKLFVGEWGSLSVLTDPYSASLSNSVRLVLNGHADVQIAQPKAFAVNKFMDVS